MRVSAAPSGACVASGEAVMEADDAAAGRREDHPEFARRARPLESGSVGLGALAKETAGRLATEKQSPEIASHKGRPGLSDARFESVSPFEEMI